ncbi:MAG: FAD-dependent oxidoreductase [Candidatus Bathyarchaeia archaeon]
MELYDLIIIGAGPAGITSAIYAARKKMHFLVLTKDIGGQVTLSSKVENYIGFQYITGEELVTKFQEHLKKYKFKLKIEEVNSIKKKNGLFIVKTNIGDYVSKTVIVATGRRPKELKVPGEENFKNKGVTYCATCDAPFFEDLNVAVIGGGNAGLDAVLQLINIAKKIYLIEQESRLKADAIMVEKAIASGKVEVWMNTKVLEILGNKFVTGIKVKKNGMETILSVQGIFVEIGSVPNSEIVNFVKKNPLGEIIVNCRCETNVPGLFAAGDVTDASEKQIVIAAGEGAKAALSAFKYISQKTD